jgi:hypothetical protein
MRVRKSSPRRAHRERCDSREIPFGVRRFVELRDRVLHFRLTRNADVQRREHLSRDPQRCRLRKRRNTGVVL